MKLGKFIFGLGLGALAGVLMAPKKGSETREDIKNTATKTYEKVKNMSKEDVQAMIGETIENVKKTVDEFDSEAFKASTKEKIVQLQEKRTVWANKVKESEQYEKVAESVTQAADTLNAKIEDVRKSLNNKTTNSDKIEAEIDDVENELDEMIDEISD